MSPSGVPYAPQAEKIWAEVARQQALDYRVVDISEPAGRTLVSDLRIKTVPALVVDGRLKAVGLHSLGDALKLLQATAN